MDKDINSFMGEFNLECIPTFLIIHEESEIAAYGDTREEALKNWIECAKIDLVNYKPPVSDLIKLMIKDYETTTL